MRFFMTGIFCFLFSINSLIHTSAIGTSAVSAVLIEAETGEIVYEKDAHTPRPMASTTKIMTALLVIETGRFDEIVTVSPAAAATIGSSIYLKAGERIYAKDLLYGLLMHSGNDAAVALAEHFGENISKFAEQMNKRAALMGLTSTQFKNPSGLPEKGHFTTAYELALIGRQGLKNEVFAEIVGTKSYKTSETENSKARYFSNSNKLLKLYPDATGMKTGFTKEAGRCLISSAARNDVTLIAVTLNDGNDWNDHIAMLNYGFENVTKEPVLLPGEVSLEREVGNGKEPVILSNDDAVSLYDGLGACKKVISTVPAIFAPVKKGDILGEVSFLKNGRLIKSVPLTAKNSVEEKPYEAPPCRFWCRLKALIRSLLLT